MTRVADDFDAIRKAMIDRGLDGDNGASLREQQKRAGSIDRELKPVVEEIYPNVAVNRGLSDNDWDDWALWGFCKTTGKHPGNRDPDTCTHRHDNDPQKKDDAWRAWNAGVEAASKGCAKPPKRMR
jgi:hypothetical protein